MIKNRIKKVVNERSCNMRDKFNVYNQIGKGQYGKVYKACVKNNDSCAAIKNSRENLKTEYNISKKLNTYNVPAVYGHTNCTGRQFLFSEYINGMDLNQYLDTSPSLSDVKTIMYKVLSTLRKIHSNLKSFRHHDLHLGNIMISKDKKPLIMDFGLTTISGVDNPTIKGDPMFKNDFGIFPDSHQMYDAHLFLNSLFVDKNTPREIKFFIQRVLGTFYVGHETKFVKNFRLRSGVKHSLPTYDRILGDDFFKSRKKTMNILKGILASKKPTVQVVNTKPKSVNNNKARQNAVAFLAKIKSKSPKKQKTPTTKRPMLRKTSAKPLTIRTSPNKKNNGTNKR